MSLIGKCTAFILCSSTVFCRVFRICTIHFCSGCIYALCGSFSGNIISGILSSFKLNVHAKASQHFHIVINTFSLSTDSVFLKSSDNFLHSARMCFTGLSQYFFKIKYFPFLIDSFCHIVPLIFICTYQSMFEKGSLQGRNDFQTGFGACLYQFSFTKR